MRLKKRIIGWLLIMIMVFVSMEAPVQAATFVAKDNRDPNGTRFLRDLQIGEYCYAEPGEAICPPYGNFLNTNMSYCAAASGSAISESIEAMPGDIPHTCYRYYITKKATDFHMAPSAGMKWCVEKTEAIIVRDIEWYGNIVEEKIPNVKFYPSINYYGVNYDLDAGSWKNKTDWIETKDGKDYGIWKSTKQQYKDDGNLYTDNIWFAYDDFEVVLPEIKDVVKEGYELKGWGTVTGSAITVAPGSKYNISASNAEYRSEWSQVNIGIKALWAPKNIGVQQVSNITLNGATFTADYAAYYDLTDKGFMYKKSTDKEWKDAKAVEKDGKLTAAITGLDTNTSYDVKGYLENQTGRIENKVISFTTGTKSSDNSGGSSSGGASSGGASSGEGNNTQATTPTITVTANTNTTSPSVTSTISTEAKSDSNGKTSAAVTENQVKEAVNKAVEEATKQGEGTAAKVEIKLPAFADAKTVETSLPKATVTEVAESKTDTLGVVTPETIISFDKAAIATIAKEATDDVKITASKVDAADLSKEAKAVVGYRPVFNFSVTSGNKTISQFGGTVTVSISYTPKKGEDTNALVIYYIDANGKAEMIKNCVYDKEIGMITFKTTHFSKYAVGYNKINFKDVPETAAYSDAVSYIAAREIMKGTGNGKFSPNNKITRGELLVMVMKAYGIEPDSDLKNNFTDAGKASYTGYLATAKKLGITAGVKNNKFAPNKKLTRQEMFNLLYDILKQINKLPSGTTDKTLTYYSDANQIANQSKEAMQFFVKAGIVKSNDGKLNPKDNANRALIAQVLYELLTKQD